MLGGRWCQLPITEGAAARDEFDRGVYWRVETVPCVSTADDGDDAALPMARVGE